MQIMSGSRPIKEGWLYKEGGATKSKWQARWFVLRGDKLQYYQKKEDQANPLGSINLSEVDDISKIGDHSGREHCLAIIGTITDSSHCYCFQVFRVCKPRLISQGCHFKSFCLFGGRSFVPKRFFFCF